MAKRRQPTSRKASPRSRSGPSRGTGRNSRKGSVELKPRKTWLDDLTPEQLRLLARDVPATGSPIRDVLVALGVVAEARIALILAQLDRRHRFAKRYPRAFWLTQQEEMNAPSVLRTRSLAACPIYAKHTDGPELHRRVCEYADFPTDEENPIVAWLTESKRYMDLRYTLEAIECIENPAFATGIKHVDEYARRSFVGLLETGSFTRAFRRGRKLVPKVNEFYETRLKQLEARGITAQPPRAEPLAPTGSVEVLLLNAMDRTPRCAEALCKLANVKFNSHAKQALAGLRKQGRCGYRKGYFVHETVSRKVRTSQD